MAANLSIDSQEVLHQFKIDLKDFTKARARYEQIHWELTAKNSSEKDPDAIAETDDLSHKLSSAWEEYLSTMRSHFCNVSTSIVEELYSYVRGEVPALQRANKLNELCWIGERWYVRNNSLFELTEPEKLAKIVEGALESASCTMRLLGLQLARIYAANVDFIRRLFSGIGSELIGLCFDRENENELDYALNMSVTLIDRYNENPKVYPEFPFGWMYRIASILDLTESMPNIIPKRKSQAVRIAIKLLYCLPAKATAASLHILLLRNCIHNGAVTKDEMQSILQTILHLFDRAETRQFIRHNDLDVLYAPFLSTTDKSTAEDITLMNSAKDVLAMVMRTWVGVLWISSESKGLRAIIDVLHLPGDKDRKMVLLTLFSKVLCQLAPHRGLTEMLPWLGDDENYSRERRLQYMQGLETDEGVETDPMKSSDVTPPNSSRSNVVNGDSVLSSYDVMLNDAPDEQEEFVPATKAVGYHVLDPILGRTLLMLTHHGLPLALISLLQGSTDPMVSLYTSLLLQDLLVLMDTVLPVIPVKRLHTALNRAVGRIALEGDFLFGREITSQLFLHQKYKRALEIRAVGEISMGDGSEMTSPVRQVSASYHFGTLDIDASAFKSLISESHVEQAQNYSGWNFDLLLLLVQGPLRSSQHFHWTLNETRFFHKLLAFYQPAIQPHMQTFVSIPIGESSSQICVLALALLDLFLSTNEGTKALDQFGFTSALLSCLQEVVDGEPRVLNHERLDTCVGRTLIRMVGFYSLSANGLMMMKDLQVFSIIDKMFTQLSGERVTAPTDNDTLHDVCRRLLRCLNIGAVPNYGVCEEIRQIFRKALCNEATSIRICASIQLRKPLWRDLSTSMRWGIETLLQALHDDFYGVVESAFKLLLSICLCSDEALDCVISLPPTVLFESDVIREHAEKLQLDLLLYRIVGRPSGFRFLQCYGWVEQELRLWEEKSSAEHVLRVECMQSGTQITETAHSSMDLRVSYGNRHRHNRTLSDPIALIHRSGVMTSSINVPTASAWNAATFFPRHFAASLCRSNEGCTFFKHSNLWQRSIKRILDQPIPPDIVLDENKDDSESDASDDGGDNLDAEDAPQWDRVGINITQTNSTPNAEMRQLDEPKEGYLPSSTSAQLISASRGYKASGQSYVLECVGSVSELKDAILCVCHATSSDTGFVLMSSVPGLLKRIISLTRFASTVSVRSIGIVGMCLIARSKRGADYLQEISYYVTVEGNAYSSADGVPYSVSFAHQKPSKWTSIGRRHNLLQRSSSLHPARLRNEQDLDSNATPMDDGLGQDTSARRIYDQIYTLSNPVRCEGAKQKLYQMLKQQPRRFLDPQIRRVLMEASQTYRMWHKERKFIADILDVAPLSKLAHAERRAKVLAPM